MVQKNTMLMPIDKNGVWGVSMFHLYGGFKKSYSKTSNFVKVSVSSTSPNNWITKKTKIVSMMNFTKFSLPKKDGSMLFTKMNSSVLLKKSLTPKGKEVLGCGLFTLKSKSFLNSFMKMI